MGRRILCPAGRAGPGSPSACPATQVRRSADPTLVLLEHGRSTLGDMSASAPWAATARLVRRAPCAVRRAPCAVRGSGFGASGTVVDDVVRVGARGWLKQVLSADPAAAPTPSLSRTVSAPLGRGATREARQARNQQITAANGQLATWWLQRRTAVHNPVIERLTFGWHGHFATSAAKVRDAASERDPAPVGARILHRVGHRAGH